jgi:hypothetical protein
MLLLFRYHLRNLLVRHVVITNCRTLKLLGRGGLQWHIVLPSFVKIGTVP